MSAALAVEIKEKAAMVKTMQEDLREMRKRKKELVEEERVEKKRKKDAEKAEKKRQEEYEAEFWESLFPGITAQAELLKRRKREDRALIKRFCGR